MSLYVCNNRLFVIIRYVDDVECSLWNAVKGDYKHFEWQKPRLEPYLEPAFVKALLWTGKDFSL